MMSCGAIGGAGVLSCQSEVRLSSAEGMDTAARHKRAPGLDQGCLTAAVPLPVMSLLLGRWHSSFRTPGHCTSL
jgi:hypothetical protein